MYVLEPLAQCVGAENFSPAHGSLTSHNSAEGFAVFTCSEGYVFLPQQSRSKHVDCMDCDNYGKTWTEKVGNCTGCLNNLRGSLKGRDLAFGAYTLSHLSNLQHDVILLTVSFV